MMDPTMIVTLVLISTFSVVNGQLHCFVCINCPNIDDLDYTVSQPCDFVYSPTSTPNTSPSSTDTSSSSTYTSPSSTDTSPSSPNTTHSSPNTPPTASTPSLPTSSAVSIENDDTPVHESLMKVTNNDTENSDASTERPHRSRLILSDESANSRNQLSGMHQCFRIERIAGDATEVVRGCVVTANTPHETCVRANVGVAPIGCRICHYDDCNTAKRNTTSSIIIVFTSIVSMLFSR